MAAEPTRIGAATLTKRLWCTKCQAHYDGGPPKYWCPRCDGERLPANSRPLVHNHGTEDGPGLACRERIVDGRRIGECVATERGLLTCPRCYPRLCGCTTPAQTPEELSDLWTRLAQLAVELEDAGDYYSRDVVCLAQYAVEELSATKGVPL